MKKINLLSTLFLLTMSPLAVASHGTEGGNGGAACVDTNGNPSTLYYCGAYHEPAPLPAPSVLPSPLSIDGPSEQPEDLDALEKYITAFPYLEQSMKDQILKAMTPSFTRKYFSTIAPPDLTAPIVARIKAEFQRATGLDSSHLTLYAVTDTNAHMDNYGDPIQVTYLLPAYFALPTQEQRMVALFHENLWVMAPNSDYPTIIAWETAFEAVMAQPNDTARLLDFITKMQGNTLTHSYMTLVLREDMASGALKGFVDQNNQFSSLQLLGGATIIDCFNKSSYDEDGGQAQPYLQCVTNYEDFLDGLRRTYPKSQFIAIADEGMKNGLTRNGDGNSDAAYIGSMGVPYQMIAYLNGDGAMLDLSYLNLEDSPVWAPTDDGAQATGTTHVLWSLAQKDSHGKVVTQRGDQVVWSSQTASTDPVMIQINTDVNAAAVGPLSTAPAPKQPSCFLGLFCS